MPAHDFQRPPLEPGLPGARFRDWYWTVSELRAFCRSTGLPTTGRKEAVARRVEAFADGGDGPGPAPATRRRRPMPTSFDDDTVVEPGWRCSEALREHLRRRLGPTFTFTGPVRAFVTGHGEGRPLRDVEAVWRSSRGVRPASVDDIEPVFEYNRFRHRYRSEHRAASAAEVTAAWEQWKAMPASAR